MDFLKKLFGGGTGQSGNGGYYVYVKPKMCKEIVQVRINLSNDLSLRDNDDGYWVRKVASATRCPFQAELTLYFSKSRQLINKEILNGEYVDEATYQAYLVESGQIESES
jgi:hypothetical protein